MKSFFKYVFATMVGIILSSVVIILIKFAIIGGLVSSISSEDKVEVADNSVLHVSLAYPISERTQKNNFSGFNFSELFDSHLGLNDILTRIEAAKTDDKIKGIYLDLSSVGAGFATLEEIRDALVDFKSSKKFIIAYSEYYSQSSYYLASVA